MNEYRQARSAVLYDAGVIISNLSLRKSDKEEEYPLATGTPPGSFRIPESELNALKSEFKSKQVATMPMGRRQGGGLSFHKVLSSYSELLGEEAQVKDLLLRVDGPQQLSIRIAEEHSDSEKGTHTETREISYCGFFAVEWARPEL
ncbi:MAG: hypothetical protein D3904_04280 [Candidatus Electrothrix sp. EH2]|nr:hypothetical protein [Candidatus Electrothrix sp. EH2]